MSKNTEYRCDDCRETTDVEMLTEHYCAGAEHFGYEKNIGLYCPYCIKPILLNEAIDLRKAKEKLRVHDGSNNTQ